VTEVAANPAGTGPPAGTVAAGPVAGDPLAAGPVAAEEGDVALTPPDGEVAGAEVVAPPPAPPAPAPECEVAHPDNASAASSTLESTERPARDVFMASPVTVGHRRGRSGPGGKFPYAM